MTTSRLTPADPVRLASRSSGRFLGDRAWDVTAVLASWFGGLILLGEAAEIRGLSGEVVFLLLVSGCLLSSTLWWRRRHPTVVAVFLAATAVVNDATGLAALIALYTVVSRHRGRPVVVAVVVNLLGGFAYAAIFPDPAVPILVSGVLVVAILATTVACGVATRSRRELIDALRERAARAEEESRLRAGTLRGLERERIAREMHDALAHRISLVSLYAGALHIRPDLTPTEVASAATLIRDSAHQALDDLREILGILRAGPEPLRPQPDLSHLPELVAEAEKAGLPVTLTDNRTGDPVTASLGRTVFRLVQEGLTNAAKHAPSTPVTVLLDGTPATGLRVHVSNPLAGPARRRPSISPAGGVSGSGTGGVPGFGSGSVPGSGTGLIGLAERVDLLDGRLRHGLRGDPRTGLTFDLEAWLPWPVPPP
ncbi:MAG TPA: histidine kinase [Actinoplanes sp.]|nr:histidine kinase [Actinoplanes sp.]